MYRSSRDPAAVSLLAFTPPAGLVRNTRYMSWLCCHRACKHTDPALEQQVHRGRKDRVCWRRNRTSLEHCSGSAGPMNKVKLVLSVVQWHQVRPVLDSQQTGALPNLQRCETVV